MSKQKLKHLSKAAMIPFSVIAVLLLIVVLAAEGKAEKTALIQHHEWIQPDIKKQDQFKTDIEVVRYGDTAGTVLYRLGYDNNEIAAVIEAAKDVYPLKNIHTGHKFRSLVEEDRKIITYQPSAEKQLQITCSDLTNCAAEITHRKIDSRIVVVEGSIQDSLFYDASKAGLDDTLIFKMVDIFAWDIDFTRDLRKNDSFKVMFEEEFNDEGKHVGNTILVAEFINDGRKYTGIRYQNKKGEVEYYDETGRNLRKTYLKSPVKYSRISSRFTSSRKHPVLGYTRAHRGVDYAAKSGTPIRAIGDGKVVFKGWKNGYGRFIEIRHNNGIHSTAYAHMKKYGKGIRKNSYVRQGQIIGYVGMSGLATGPHLHFEFRSRGVAVNPLKIKHKSAMPVAKEELTLFTVKSKELLRKLAQQSQDSEWG